MSIMDTPTCVKNDHMVMIDTMKGYEWSIPSVGKSVVIGIKYVPFAFMGAKGFNVEGKDFTWNALESAWYV